MESRIRDSHKLGHLLVQEGLIRVDQLQAALAEQKQSGKSLGQILVSLGAIDALQLAMILARQFEDARLHVPTGEVFVFLGVKGGVGTTMLTVNAALGMAHSGRRVCLIDLQLILPQIHLQLNLARPGSTLGRLSELPGDLDDEQLLESLLLPCRENLHLVAGPCSFAAGEEIQAPQIQRLISAARRHFDFVVVDLPPLFDERAMTVLDMCDRIALVADAGVGAMSNAIRLMDIFQRLSYPETKMYPIINRHRKGDLAAAELQRYFRFPIRSIIRFSPDAAEDSVNRAQPLLDRLEGTPLHQDLIALVNGLVDRPLLATPSVSGFWQRIFRAEQVTDIPDHGTKGGRQ